MAECSKTSLVDSTGHRCLVFICHKEFMSALPMSLKSGKTLHGQRVTENWKKKVSMGKVSMPSLQERASTVVVCLQGFQKGGGLN